MTVSIADFRARFPEYADETTYPDATIQINIDDTTVYIGENESHWGAKYDMAQAYLAAHLLSSSLNLAYGDKNSKAGVVSSKTAGGVSVTRAVSSKDRSDTDEFFI